MKNVSVLFVTASLTLGLAACAADPAGEPAGATSAALSSKDEASRGEDPAPVFKYESEEDARAAADAIARGMKTPEIAQDGDQGRPSCFGSNVTACIRRHGCWNPAGACTAACAINSMLYCEGIIRSFD